MIELLYVSRAGLAPGGERAQVERILEVARPRNLALGVTGALICMNGLFAQVLEGRRDDVNHLMVAILRDTRHADVRIVWVADIAQRRFATWSMAEVPSDPAAAALLDTLARPHPGGPPGEAAEALIRFMAGRAGSARLGAP